MTVHTIFALIDDGEVKNIVVGEYYDCDQVAKATYGDSAFAIDITQYPVQIGDTYENGNFYRIVNGMKKKVEYIPTDSEKIDSIIISNEETLAYLEEVATLLIEIAEGQG